MTAGNAGGQEPTIFGVPGTQLVTALRTAGLNDDAVVAVVGRAIAQSAGVRPAAAAPQGFVFTTQVAETAPECALSYQRVFVHPDFVDGVTVVQGGATPDEIGFNARFHGIEAEFDSIARNLQTSGNCMAELRRELFGVVQELQAKITEIDQRLDAKGKDNKETKEKDTKEGKDAKEGKEKDTKEGKDKEGKDAKESKDGKEHTDKPRIEKITALEKATDLPLATGQLAVSQPGTAGQPGEPAEPEGSERTFIGPGDRPPVGEDALREPGQEPE